jgi:hypothetical protein
MLISGRRSLVAAIACTLAAGAATAFRADGNTQQAIGTAMTFHASFDKGVDADFALGDTHIYTAPSYKNLDAAKPGLHNPEVVLAGKGRYGGALEFKAKNTAAIYYEAGKNIDYRKDGWSGTVSFWLSLDPDKDLAGFSDPVQITDKAYNDAAFWVDFTQNPPRQARLGVFGDLKAWNPDDVRGQTHPGFVRHLVAVDAPPFGRDRWTHVAFTFAGLNGQQPGSAGFFLNGKLQGRTEPIPEPFTWDVARAKIRVGLNYVGLLDDLTIFNRALSESEVQTVYGLAAGASRLR